MKLTEHAHMSQPAVATTAAVVLSVGPPRSGQVIRAACLHCGAHVNTLAHSRLTPGCPNCGGYELAPVTGAAPLEGPELAPLY